MVKRLKGNSTPVSDEELRKDVEAYTAEGGNKSAAARRRGIPRITFLHRLELAEKRFGIALGKIVDGRLKPRETEVWPMPRKGYVRRYILTSAQNNTHVHPGFENLIAYQQWLDALPKSDCRLIVGTFSYQLDAYGKKAVKFGTYKREDHELWYAPELMPYLVDHSVEIAPALVWCGEMNILPTMKNPLTGLDNYNGRASNIFPHAKIAMESVSSLADEATKFNYTTGTITLRNYIQKRVGIISEKSHKYGAVLVEVDDAGNWYVRQLEIADDNTVYDIGPRGHCPVKIVRGKVKEGRFVDAINWGDIHTAEMELWVRELGWGKGGMLDTLNPRRQIMHDIFSMRARSHHEMKDFHRTFQKFVDNEDSVEGEMQVTADFLAQAYREEVETVIVPSNHHRHIARWLNEVDVRRDPTNARYYLKLQAAILDAIQHGNKDFDLLRYALEDAGLKVPVRFLGEDESFIICRGSIFGGIECGLHGDLGPNGSRGTTRNLAQLGRPVMKNHDHRATWRGDTTSGGACSLKFPYMKGPHAHSVSHTVAFENGARQIVTMWANKFRA